jgi:hypothetical protein
MPPELHPELARRAALVESWNEALAAAEHHGLGPLLYRHLRAGEVHVPPSALVQLQGIYIRHRRNNNIRLDALREILDAFDTHHIQARVLKGPALMDLVYDEPALRPSSDLDLLVSGREVFRAQQVLRDAGFRAPGKESDATLRHHHHLPMATRPGDGMLVQVELHHDVLSEDDEASIRLDEPREPPTAFNVSGRTASALGPHEMLWHLCQHLVGPLPRPLRLIWVADALGYAEAFCERLDWDRLGRQYAIVLNVLGLAHTLTPLPATVLRHVPIRTIEGLHGLGDRGDAWSSAPGPGTGQQSRLRQLVRTLNPPTWWLQLRYGTRTGPAGFLERRARHFTVVGRAVRRRARRAIEGGREV